MQQTQNYKLNKPETTDPFTPAPLNENADKLEGALTALDERVTTLEAHKIAAGCFKGNGGTQTIELGFTPIAVFITHRSAIQYTFAVTDFPSYPEKGTAHVVTIVENGFVVRYSSVINSSGGDNAYFAIG